MIVLFHHVVERDTAFGRQGYGSVSANVSPVDIRAIEVRLKCGGGVARG